MGKHRTGIELLRVGVRNLDYCNEDFLLRWSAEELVRIINAYEKCEDDFMPDTWTERQLQECVQFNIVPKWNAVTTHNGGTNYVPVHYSESKEVFNVEVSWTTSATVQVYGKTSKDAVDWAKGDMPTPQNGKYVDDTFRVEGVVKK